MTIDGDSDGSGDRVTLDANDASRVLRITGGATDVALQDLRITGGQSFGRPAAGSCSVPATA